MSCIRWLAANPEVNAREHHGHGHSHGHSHNGGTAGQGHGHGHTIVDVSASGKHATVQDVVVAAGGGGGNPVVTANPLAGAAGIGSSSTDATGSIKGSRGGGRQSVLARTTGKRAHKAKVPSFTAEELAVIQQRGQQDPVDPRLAKVEVHTQQQQQHHHHHHLVLLVRLVSGLTSRHCGVRGCPLSPQLSELERCLDLVDVLMHRLIEHENLYPVRFLGLPAGPQLLKTIVAVSAFSVVVKHFVDLGLAWFQRLLEGRSDTKLL